ncbi:hypothetical protein, partial [Bacillus thuringiensis]|uniref:hypothetical protein n=1 Tax=Bacillus thuringiensis TaxID=1428 RepID=UPI001E2ECAC1
CHIHVVMYLDFLHASLPSFIQCSLSTFSACRSIIGSVSAQHEGFHSTHSLNQLLLSVLI